MSRIIFYTVLFYILYKIVVDFIIPVGKASSQVRRNMQQMQQQQAKRQEYQQQPPQPQPDSQAYAKETEKEYIEFEEIK